MHLRAPFALLLILITAAEATLASRSSGFFNRVHHSAIKRSAGLARDIRATMRGILVEQSSSDSSNRAVYCVANNNAVNPGSNSGNNTIVPGTVPSSSSSRGGGSSSTSVSNQPSSTVSGSSAPSPSVAPSEWKLVQTYEGDSFFDEWDFWNLPDPTHGIVDYVDQSTAQSNNLISINSAGNAIMRVETTPTVQNNRKSVRIHTKRSYNGAIFIMDSVHMPTGCGTWPAFWSNGPNWPQGGEIDVLEGVNDYTNNQATIHTNPGCTLASTSSSILSISGDLVASTNCAAAETGNAGCGIRADSSNTYGPGFNSNGGGVYAMQWDASGIAVFFFPRNSIPADITAGAPQPSSWGLAQARWPAVSCDPFKFFYDHIAIFDTTLCGDWASGVWNSAGIPGQEQSCAARTGFSTCEAFVRASGSSFNEAYWEVKSFKVYQQNQ